MNPLQALEEQFGRIIEQMPDQFDSHAFIFKLVSQNQQLYAHALTQFDNTTPFTTLNAWIAQRLREQQGVRQMNEKHDSMNIVGNVTKCELWERVR